MARHKVIPQRLWHYAFLQSMNLIEDGNIKLNKANLLTSGFLAIYVAHTSEANWDNIIQPQFQLANPRSTIPSELNASLNMNPNDSDPIVPQNICTALNSNARIKSTAPDIVYAVPFGTIIDGLCEAQVEHKVKAKMMAMADPVVTNTLLTNPSLTISVKTTADVYAPQDMKI